MVLAELLFRKYRVHAHGHPHARTAHGFASRTQEILLLLPDERYHLIAALDKFLHLLRRAFMLDRIDPVLLEILQRTGKVVFLGYVVGLRQPVKPDKRLPVNGDRGRGFLIHTIAVLIDYYTIKSLIYKDMILIAISK